MPRLTTLDYLRNRSALRKEWFENNGYAVVVLSPTEQFLLHDYYAFTKDLSPLEVTEHRKAVTVRRTSLPHQAGKAFARIRPFLDRQIINKTAKPVSTGPRKWKSKNRRVMVFSQVNPELDPAEFARIIIAAAKKGPPPGWKPDDPK